jgi:hypothetical protein
MRLRPFEGPLVIRSRWSLIDGFFSRIAGSAIRKTPGSAVPIDAFKTHYGWEGLVVSEFAADIPSNCGGFGACVRAKRFFESV